MKVNHIVLRFTQWLTADKNYHKAINLCIAIGAATAFISDRIPSATIAMIAVGTVTGLIALGAYFVKKYQSHPDYTASSPVIWNSLDLQFERPTKSTNAADAMKLFAIDKEDMSYLLHGRHTMQQSPGSANLLFPTPPSIDAVFVPAWQQLRRAKETNRAMEANKILEKSTQLEIQTVGDTTVVKNGRLEVRIVGDAVTLTVEQSQLRSKKSRELGDDAEMAAERLTFYEPRTVN